MKNPTYLIILLALGLIFVSYKWISSIGKSSDTVETASATNSTIEDIMTRTSVRQYSDRPVSKETVDTFLRAAMAAPTAVNKQPWRFVVIDKRTILNSIAGKFNSMTMASQAQLAVVLCGDMDSALEGEGREYWVQDVSAATENLLLAAHSLGLGAVWCGIYPIKERVAEFSSMLNLPENIIPLACVCIGYPNAPTTPKDKWKPENIHYNSWTDPIDVQPSAIAY